MDKNILVIYEYDGYYTTNIYNEKFFKYWAEDNGYRIEEYLNKNYTPSDIYHELKDIDFETWEENIKKEYQDFLSVELEYYVETGCIRTIEVEN